MSPYQWSLVLQSAMWITIAVICGWVAYQNVKRFRKNNPPPAPVRKRTPIEYQLRLGTNVFIGNVGAAHGKIVIIGWHEGWWRWATDDLFVLYTADGKYSTRYKIERVEGRPADKYFWAECTFAPRGA